MHFHLCSKNQSNDNAEAINFCETPYINSYAEEQLFRLGGGFAEILYVELIIVVV